MMTSACRKVWRDGIAPLLSVEGLRALRAALLSDDSRLVQGTISYPYPLPQFAGRDVEAADAIGFAAWQGDHLQTVSELEEHFAAVSRECDNTMGFSGATGEFIRWYDSEDRETLRGLLIIEVDRAIAINLEEVAA